jgi:hypothetical protein
VFLACGIELTPLCLQLPFNCCHVSVVLQCRPCFDTDATDFSKKFPGEQRCIGSPPGTALHSNRLQITQ